MGFRSISYRRSFLVSVFAPRKKASLALGLLAVALWLSGTALSAQVQNLVSFSKTFNPGTTGPGSVSTLTFEVGSEEPAPVTDLAFTDTLPAPLTLASPAFVSNTCGGTLTAPEGGTTITLSGGAVGASSSCQITVDVTGTTLGAHQNVSGDLTSSAGNSGPAVATLTITADRPGFSKSFSPDMVQLGETTTLTFTLDNTANGGAVDSLEFTDTLPPGLIVASPANAGTDCPLNASGAFAAAPGGSTITYQSGFVAPLPTLAAGASCTLSVDVTATAVGRLDNRTSDLTSSAGNSGKASDSLTVAVDELALIKSFVDDPVPPGGFATLEFSITNLNRDQTATGVTFTDDLDATLSGLVAVPPLPADPCGAGSTLSGTSLLTLTGGTLGPGETCTFQVTLQVPAGASPGSFPNTTSSVTGTVGGGSVTGSPATDTLEIRLVPVVTKEFIDDPVGSGGTVTLRFTLVNTSSTSALTDIAFTDDLGAVIPGLAAKGLVSGQAADPRPDVCGVGSELSVFDPPDIGPIVTPADPTRLIFTGGSLTTAGSAGDSCSFDVVLDVPTGVPGGLYFNTTSEVTATGDDTTQTGPPATDTLTVVGAPRLVKEFTDDPVDPGGTVTLQFTLGHDEFAPGDATDFAFTDDLDAALSGLVATGLPQNDVCGAGSSISGTSSLSFTGGTLAPGESCTISVTLQVPLDAPPGFHTNTTSAVTATVAGAATTGNAATEDLLVSGVELTKQFLGDPVLPGSTVILRFTITNDNPDFEATGISFTDNLDDVISGLSATGLPQNDICGMDSSISGTTNLSFVGGSLAAGAFCTFDVTAQVPVGTVSDTYFNVTGPLTATLDGQVLTFGNAVDDLLVDANLLDLAKEFTDDPASPGGTVTLEFTLTNLSATETITDIAFTDDLDAALAGLVSESGTQMDVCGTGSQLAGMSVLSFAGGTLAPGETCTFSATLRLPDVIAGGGAVTNVTSAPAGTAGGLPVEGPAASDELVINLLAFFKAFEGPTAATGTAVLTFTLENLSATTAAADLGFTDDLDAVVPGLVATGTPQSGICDVGSQITGTSLLTFSGGSLAPATSCTFGVTLAVPADAAPGSFLNTTSALRTAGLVVAAPATASLEIEPPPGFSKVFSPTAVTVGGVSTLTFTLDNGASVLDATGLAFSDNLPAGVEVASTPDASSTCGGTVTANPGTGVVSLSGGAVMAGGSCTVRVDVVGTAEGSFVNTTGDLTSSLGSSGTATDTLDVVAGEFVALKSFRSAPVLRGGLVEMELSIVNGSVFALTEIALTDDLGAVLPGLAAEGLPLMDVCGTGSLLAGTSVVSLTGGNLAPGASCTVVVPVRVPADAPLGTFTNTTSPVTAVREGVPVDAGAASADLTVAFLAFSKDFSAASVRIGETVQLTFTLTNPDPANGISALTFSDDLDAVFAGLEAVDTPQTDVCGPGSEISGQSLLVFTGGSLGPGALCSFTVTLAVPSGPGDIVENVTGVPEGVVDGAAVAGDPASAARASIEILGILAIPTLSFWMLVLLAGLLILAGLHRLRGV